MHCGAVLLQGDISLSGQGRDCWQGHAVCAHRQLFGRNFRPRLCLRASSGRYVLQAAARRVGAATTFALTSRLLHASPGRDYRCRCVHQWIVLHHCCIVDAAWLSWQVRDSHTQCSCMHYNELNALCVRVPACDVCVRSVCCMHSPDSIGVHTIVLDTISIQLTKLIFLLKLQLMFVFISNIMIV